MSTSLGSITMTTVPASSMDLGKVPFNIYTRDHSGRLVLFCRAGLEITEKHVQILRHSDRQFYVGSVDFDTYLDYAFERINNIVADATISSKEKAHIVRGVGRRIVSSMLRDPSSGDLVTRGGDFAESLVELILRSPQTYDHLFSLSSRESYLLSHSINVCTLSAMLGVHLFGQKKEAVWMLGVGGLLHDIGMTKIDSAIYNKPDSRTDEEDKEFRRHPIIGLDFLAPHGLPSEVLATVEQHHERFDGKGFNKGLPGRDTHPYARIVAIADIYDDLTTERPYRKPVPNMLALEIIANSKGKFDPVAFNALVSIVLQHDKLIELFSKKVAGTQRDDVPKDADAFLDGLKS